MPVMPSIPGFYTIDSQAVSYTEADMDLKPWLPEQHVASFDRRACAWSCNEVSMTASER